MSEPSPRDQKKNIHVVVTGASKGIGRAVAEIFAGAGCRLSLCARNETLLQSTASELQRQYPGAKVRAKPADMGKKGSVREFAEWCLQEGTVDILVNNAGQFLPGSFSSEADGVLEAMIENNLYSAYHLTRLFLPGMMQAGHGHIFNMCSTASLLAYPNGGSYSISKFALLGFSKNLREELKPHGIKVTAVMPGAVYTDSWSGSNVLPERIMQVQDVAAMIFAASQLSPQACVEDIVLAPQQGDLD